jgi:hypothetical protein
MTNSTWKIAATAAMGLTFGFALEKGKVFAPAVIVDQMLLSNFTMMIMFLAAVASSAVWLVITSFVFPKDFKVAQKAYVACCGKGIIPVAVGALILGVGFALAGACPGTVLAQLGAGVPTAPVVMLGGLTAVLAYAHLERNRSFKSWLFSGAPSHPTLDGQLKMDYATLALGLAMAMIFMVLFFSALFPPSVSFFAHVSLSSVAWHPAVAGLLIGTLQIPAVLFASDTLGSASAYMTVGAELFYKAGLVPSETHRKYSLSDWGNRWQVIYVGMVPVGAFLSSVMGGTFGNFGMPGMTLMRAFVGGFCLIFGSRIASGCTSGHGISGMAMLAMNSFIAVPAMFAGGIIYANLFL